MRLGWEDYGREKKDGWVRMRKEEDEGKGGWVEKSETNGARWA